MARKTISLSFLKQGDTRKPITTELLVLDEATGNVETYVRLDEHGLSQLLSGSVLVFDSSTGRVVR